MSPEIGRRIVEHVHGLRDEFVAFLTALATVESPTDEPATQAGVHALLVPALEREGLEVRFVRGRRTGDQLFARPRRSDRRGPAQLLIGHSDTVWPVGTLSTMPVEVRDGRLHGPGTLDMKGGLVQIVLALRTLRDLGLTPALTPVVFVNADEEIGSPDSKRTVARIARHVRRTFVIEPAMGPHGRIKTARKGVGNFVVRICGKAAHAGLDPGAGASAILELAHVVEALHEMGDPDSGTTVNVGRVSGGSRANVVAADARAEVDVRVTDGGEAARMEARIRALRPRTPGVTLEVSGGFVSAPLERTPRNRRLWEAARAAGRDVGLSLEECLAGGGSDGNTTSLHTATLDGLGCVGDGAHALHEHVEIGPSLDRCALLARLLLLPADPDPA